MKRFAALTGAVVLSMLLLAPAALAAPVETVTEDGDADDGTCDGTCTLRAAIADVDPGGTIQFNAGADPTITTTQLAITKSMTIDGQGMGATTITINNALTPSPARAFLIDDATVARPEVTISDLRITGGRAPNGADGAGVAAGGPGGGGGAILNKETLGVLRVRFDDNRGGNGGPTTGFVGGSGGGGGAIYTQTPLTVDDSVFEDNHGGGGGAGSLMGTTVGGPGGNGGAIAIEGDGNTGLIRGSLLSRNKAGNGGPGISGGGSGGAIYTSAGLDVLNSTISRNASGSGYGTGPGGGIRATGGAGAVSIRSTTIFYNTVPFGTFSSDGGGISADPNPVTLVNSILVSNIAPPGGVSNCDEDSVINGGGNVGYQVDSECPAGLASGDPLLASDEPVDNGGPTKTIAFLPGSSALDQIPPAQCLGLTTDQRGAGFPRPVGTNCDIGAWESPFGVTLPNPPGGGLSTPPVTTRKKCKKGRKLKKGKCVKRKKKK